MNETDEEYRLGYVAYSRPRKLLVLSCLEDIDCSKLDKNLFEIIQNRNKISELLK